MAASASPPPGIVGFGTGEQSPAAGATLCTRDVLRQRNELGFPPSLSPPPSLGLDPKR